jgi:hypothetical protein
MGNEKKEAREFEKDLDRQIASEQVKIPESAESDHEKNLCLTGKMLESKIEPSAAFQANLKQRLMLKLTEQENQAEKKKEAGRSFRDIFKNLGSQSLVWRTAAVTAAVIIIAVLVVWRAGVFSQPARPPLLGVPPPVTTGSFQWPVEVRATSLQDSYKPGEPVSVTLTFKNTGRGTLTLSPYPPQILIAAASLKPYMTIPGGESRTLAPGEAAEYTVSWDQRDNEGQQVPPGTYIIEMLDIQLDNGNSVALSDSPRITIISP